jgi:hypothetical protein
MRANRFRRRDESPGDLTEVIAEARSTRINAGFFGICGLGLVAGCAAIGIAATSPDSSGSIVYGITAGLMFVIAFLEIGLSFRAAVTARQRERAAARVVLLLLGLGLLAAALHQWFSPVPSRDLALWLVYGGVIACTSALIMPWSATDAATTTLPAFLVWILLLFVIPNSSIESFGRVALAVSGIVVGAIPVWLGYLTDRKSQDDDERAALSREVSHTRDELGRARIVHDAMFRPPLAEGPVEVSYRYDPLREIGGDFVHILRCPRSDRVTTTVIDVSGHGLAAALTVNRLFGELERVIAEAKGEVTPADLMTQLNRYIHLTMSAHSMFAASAASHREGRSTRLHDARPRRGSARVLRSRGTVAGDRAGRLRHRLHRRHLRGPLSDRRTIRASQARGIDRLRSAAARLPDLHREPRRPLPRGQPRRRSPRRPDHLPRRGAHGRFGGVSGFLRSSRRSFNTEAQRAQRATEKALLAESSSNPHQRALPGTRRIRTHRAARLLESNVRGQTLAVYPLSGPLYLCSIFVAFSVALCVLCDSVLNRNSAELCSLSACCSPRRLPLLPHS